MARRKESLTISSSSTTRIRTVIRLSERLICAASTGMINQMWAILPTGTGRVAEDNSQEWRLRHPQYAPNARS